MAKRTINNVEITADRIVAKLIDHIMGMEKKMQSMQQEINSHLEMIAELQPKLREDGLVSLRAMTTGDSAEEVHVFFRPIKTPKPKEQECPSESGESN